MFLNSYVKSRFALFCFAACSVITILILKHRAWDHAPLSPRPAFLVDTTGCKIPNFDPFDPTVLHLVNESELVSCAALPPLTYVDEERLGIDRAILVADYQDDLEYCEYQAIHRGSTEEDRGDVDNGFRFGKSVRFSEDVVPGVEFLRVACYRESDGGLMYTNFHAFVLERGEVEERCGKKFEELVRRNPKFEVYNLLILGMDSVSRLNLMRHMPRVRSFLLDELGAIDLVGYNKVADNTYVNLVPMFAGKYVEELPWDERSSDVPFDNFTFIWNNYSANGYRTLYAEDAPNIAIFNYHKAGFHRPPADYYLRPFSLALEDHGAMWEGGSEGPRNCVGGKLETEVVLDYIFDFERRFRSSPHLSFSFITRLTHERINKAASADAPYLHFFHRLRSSNLLENTIILFYSDHGMRFGDIRQTYIGKMEERLPFAFLAFPPKFRAAHPDWMSALRRNSLRLTTPFDVYETLRDLSTWKRVGQGGMRGRGYSLFGEVPVERTCVEAGILPHWCACHGMRKLERDDHNVVGIARSVVGYVNQILTQYGGRCVQLKLGGVVDAWKVIPNDEVLRFKRSRHDVIGRVVEFDDSSSVVFEEYQVTFNVKPGGGMFEATVKWYTGDGRVEVGDVSRINEYGGQAECIDVHKDKKFCFCR